MINKRSIRLLGALNGDMSLIGSRADVLAHHVEYIGSRWRECHRVMYGFAGLVRSSLRSDEIPAQRLEMYLRYVYQHIFGMDCKAVMNAPRQPDRDRNC